MVILVKIYALIVCYFYLNVEIPCRPVFAWLNVKNTLNV